MWIKKRKRHGGDLSMFIPYHARSLEPIAMVGAFVLPDGMNEIIEQSTTLNPSTPPTRSRVSTTDIGSSSGPIHRLPEE